MIRAPVLPSPVLCSLGLHAAALTVMLATPLAAQQMPPGQALFQGQAGDGAFRRHPCIACHKRDATGGVEGRAPDLIALRQAYDPARLHRALADGIAADGRRLSRNMPRFAASADQAAALHDWLAALPAHQRRGVWPDRLVLGVLSTNPQDGYAQDLRRALATALPDGRLFGRRIEIRVFATPAAAEADSLALIGLDPALDARPVTRLGLPVLFPRSALSGDEDASITRGLTPSQEDIAAALAGEMRQRGADAVILTGEIPAPLAAAINREFPRRKSAFALLAGDGARLPAAPMAGAPAFLLPQALPLAAAARDAGWQPLLVVDAPHLLDRMLQSGQDPQAAHAALAGAVLVSALEQTGRDVTRLRLVESLSAAPLNGLGLDYRTHRLTGTGAIRVLPVP